MSIEDNPVKKGFVAHSMNIQCPECKKWNSLGATVCENCGAQILDYWMEGCREAMK